jgi:hypothetical protein
VVLLSLKIENLELFVSTVLALRHSETYRLSNFIMSAWEYEAPTTKPGSRAGFFGEGSRRPSEVRPRQKGEADLECLRQSLPTSNAQSSLASAGLFGTYSDLSV